MTLNSLSSYPSGFGSGVMIGGRPVLADFAGNVFWVNSATGSNGNKGTRSRPFATLDYAFSKCAANQGDVIYVAPNHAETITGAGGISHDVAGVSVIGLGNYNQRPRFLMDAGTTVTYLISAADAYVSGLEFASGHSNVATCFNVTGVGAHINDCKFRNNTTNEDFLVCITASGAANTADGLRVTKCDWYTIDTDDSAMISLVDNVKDLWVWDNHMVTSSATAAQLITQATGKITLNGDIGWNRLVNAMTAGELFISNDGTTNTGVIHNNYVGHADVTGTHDPGWDGGGWRLFGNLSTSVDNLQGLLIPAADVNL